MIVMRYRIKKYTKLDGSEYFNAQVKKWYGWKNLSHYGDELSCRISWMSKLRMDLSQNRESALSIIDNHLTMYQHSITKSVEIEYITK